MRCGELSHQSSWRKLQVQTGKHAFGVRFDTFAVDQTQWSPERFPSQKNVRRNIQRIDDFQFLMDDPNSELCGFAWRSNDGCSSLNLNGSGIRLIDTGKDLHQRGFSSAVFTDQRQHLTAADLEMDVIEGSHTRESFCDSRHLESIHVKGAGAAIQRPASCRSSSC